MFEKKNLIVNCEVCDARKISEEDYSKYEQIMINAEIVLVDDRAKGVLARLPVTLNAEEILSVPEGVEIDLRVYNGDLTLGADSTASEHTVIVVNGALKLTEGAQEPVHRCRKIIVNGSVDCPRSMAACLGKMKINGENKIYPDSAVLLEERFVMDRFFPLRAKQDALYYAAHRVLIADPALDAEKLAAKNVSFVTPELVVPEAFVEPLAPLFDADTAFVVVPAGFALVPDSAVLDETLLSKYGPSLYICGDLDIPADSQELLGQIQQLSVTGSVTLPVSCKPAFDALHASAGSVMLVKGKVIANAAMTKIDRRTLDLAPDGLTIKNAAMVTIHADVSAEEILEKLDIKNAALIRCTSEQRSAVEMIAANAAHISAGEDDDPQGPGANLLGGLFSGAKALLGTKLVNAETHVL